jgi:hypothetical protein
VVLVPFRVNALLVLVSSYIMPIVYNLKESAGSEEDIKNPWSETDLFNLNVDHDVSVQFSKHDNSLVYDDDFDLPGPRSRRGTTGDKAKAESRRKTRVCCGKFWGYVG